MLETLCLALIQMTPKQPPSQLIRTAQMLEMCRQDLPSMKPIADQAAERLVKGGKLWAAGSQQLVSEMLGRAGGFMMLRALGDAEPTADDVVLYFPDDGKPLPKSAPGSAPLVITFGTGSVPAGPHFPTHASECGVSETVGMAARGWIFTGELVAALTRLGKMPVMYETIGLPSGVRRIQKFENGAVCFHEETPKPIEPGVTGSAYIDKVSAMLRRIEKEERKQLDTAGAWAREARAQGKQLYMYSMGHMFPVEVNNTELSRVFKAAAWNTGSEYTNKPDSYAPGDLVVYLGYHHPAADLLKLAHAAGARAVYVTVRSDRDLLHDKNTIYIDPMWDWPDSCVSLDSYDIPILPASGVISCAIAWEIYRLAIGKP